ncbi:MAG: MinD/ParA family protein [Pirellulaceae bacterium]|nr:MinD/ParA family protein [Pirellulaceae bacterium]
MIDQANRLRTLMRQQAEQAMQPSREGPGLVVVAGGKGGVGTTTVAIHLALAMARQCDRGLLVDADPDRADVATLCGLRADRDLVDLAAARRPLDEVLVPGPDGIVVVHGAGRAVADQTPIDRFHQRWIATVADAEEPFDHVIVDAGNGSTDSVKTLWQAADLVLLVTTAELPSIMDAYASMKTLADRAAPPAIHTLVNRVNEPAVAYDVHGRLARAAWRFLGFHLSSAGYLAAGAVGSRLVSEERTGGQIEPSSDLARDFGQLARTLRAALNDSKSRFWSAKKRDPSELTNGEAVELASDLQENTI